MSVEILVQYFVSGLMLAMIYSLVAVGLTLFFGVLDIIHFVHGVVFVCGSFAAFASFIGLSYVGVSAPWLQLLLMMTASISVLAMLGVLTARYLVLPLKGAPALNVLLMTMMLGTLLRESVRLYYP